MKTNAPYAGLDYFKLLAAVLVIAVHTSPLLSLHAEADFVLTRIIARVAVPFFFMATGFFMLPQYLDGSAKRGEGMRTFIRKTSLLYLAAILLYLPVNVYAGYFKENSLGARLLKDIVFDGTFYHLWYLPASLLGAVIVLAITRLSDKLAVLFVVTGILYLIGLLGDSYFGLIQNMEPANSFYTMMFGLFDYTRNGIFLAPIFLALGAAMGRRQQPLPIKTSLTGLTVSFALLMTEGLLLHSFSLQRHDSMYVMLLPSMYFLFQLLINWRAPVDNSFRKMSMLIYIIHPLWIIVIRGFAKLTRLQPLLIDNSFIHFTAVTAASIISAFLLTKLPKLRVKHKVDRNRAWAEINLSHLRHNVAELQRILPASCQFMAVVKANAYGHGDLMIAKELNKIGVNSFAVAALSEAVRLRKHGIKGDILILSHTHPQDITKIKKYKLIQTVGDYNYGKMLSECGVSIRVHIKIDTGMHRLGESYENIANIAQIYSMKHLAVEGIYTHLSRSDSLDEADIAFTRLQIQHFNKTIEQLKDQAIRIGKTHVQSSYGVLNYPELQYDYARIGIAMYGLLSNEHDLTRMNADLQPVLALKARVVMVKDIEDGQSVGYGSNCTIHAAKTIAVVSIGYADGIPRNLSCGNGDALINGRKAPIIGNICMDQLMIDITGQPQVQIGDVVTLIGQEGEELITAEQVAAHHGSITNDLLSRLGSRLERVG